MSPTSCSASEPRENLVVEVTVGRDRVAAVRAGRALERGESTARGADDDVERGEVPQRHLGFCRDVDRALKDLKRKK